MIGQSHPLGYRKISLLKLFGYRIRLHIWSGRNENAHDHRWDFVSVVLRGELVERRFVETDGNLIKVATAPDRGAGRAYTPAGTAGLVETSRTVRKPLRPYRCRRGVIHSATATPGTVSLVVLGRPRSITSDVWRQP